MSKTSDRLKYYQTQMSIYAEQHKLILASDVLDMIEQLQDDLRNDVEKVVAELKEITYDMEICEEQFDMNSPYFMDVDYEMVKIDEAIDIVRKGGME